ncbi:MAG: pilus assembly protein PilP [Proteobacteria bacterium]|nr:pilus assembly protein PilP [Pseudomonadota bacterium]MBU1640910.1 pilus assembly protein PilP [Pseudomonadota bacterium]
MKTLTKKIMRYFRPLVFWAVIFGVVLIAPSGFAQTSPSATDGGSKENSGITEEAYSENVKELMNFLEGRESDFVYQREGRSDPFMPFIKDKVVKEADIEVDDYGVLTGMQKFEPGQLTVVAIIQKQQGPIAMVQDPTGKGYILTLGEKLGRNGVVEEITSNMILIKQEYKMTSGALRHRVVKMLLKREGE